MYTKQSTRHITKTNPELGPAQSQIVVRPFSGSQAYCDINCIGNCNLDKSAPALNGSFTIFFKGASLSRK